MFLRCKRSVRSAIGCNTCTGLDQQSTNARPSLQWLVVADAHERALLLQVGHQELVPCPLPHSVAAYQVMATRRRCAVAYLVNLLSLVMCCVCMCKSVCTCVCMLCVFVCVRKEGTVPACAAITTQVKTVLPRHFLLHSHECVVIHS